MRTGPPGQYGFAYRVLDAQYIRVDGFGRAVPQRRRRVFVIGYLGDWRPPAAVLFDAQSLRRTSEPCRKEGQGVAGKLSQENEGRRSPAIGWCEQLTARIELAGTLQRGGSGGRHEGVFADFLIRRYTPLECERLQGFSDDFTRIPWLGKAAKNCPNGLRYKALGNSMAVNCMRWLGRRIQIVEQISCEILADCGELAP
ncbi:MAG: DNA cytosine methyltransferase [Paracoccaceae bacterium]